MIIHKEGEYELAKEGKYFFVRNKKDYDECFGHDFWRAIENFREQSEVHSGTRELFGIKKKQSTSGRFFG